MREEGTSFSAGFHAGGLSWLNWNLEMLLFVEGGKTENLEKKSSEQGENPPPGGRRVLPYMDI